MNSSIGPETLLDWELSPPDALTSVASEWDALVTSVGYPAFMRSAFISRCVAVFGSGQGKLVLGRRGGALVAGGIIMPTGLGRWMSFQPSQLPLGAWLMEPGCRWLEVFNGLAKVLPGVCTSLSITQQDPWLVERPQTGSLIDTLDYVQTGWIDTEGSFSNFWEARGKNLRQGLRKQQRKLEEQGGPLRFEFLDRPEDVDSAFREFAALESAGWKSEQGTAITADNQQGAFYRSMLEEFAVADAGFAIRLTQNGRPLAVDFGVRDSRSLVLLKTTYDESLKAFSPGQLLHYQAFEHFFDFRSAGRIEFYGKLMEWHTRWTEQSRMLFHINFYPSRLLRFMHNAVRRARH